MPLEGRAAFHTIFPTPQSKQFNRFNKFKEKLIYFYWPLVLLKLGSPPATMVAETVSIVVGGGP
jgi:hypothetical protein